MTRMTGLRGLVAALAVGVLGIGVALAMVSRAPGAFPGRNGPIVFDSDRGPGTDRNVFVMKANGRGERTLSSSSGDDWYASYSASGRKIVFVSGRDGDDEIFLMKANGRHEHQLTRNSASDFFPAFSPNGKRIYFSSDRSGDSEIFVMRAGGSRQHALTDNNAEDSYPTISPSGRRLAFYGTTAPTTRSSRWKATAVASAN